MYYILEFSVSESFGRRKFGTQAIREPDKIYSSYDISELLVSAKNFIGMNFRVNIGFTEITLVLPPEAQGTVSTELNLRGHIQRQ